MLKTIDIMNRAKFLKYGSKMILRFDLSNLENDEDVRKVIDYFYSIVKRMPKKSIIGLIDINNLTISENTRNEIARFPEKCNPYFKASAVVNLDESAVELTNLAFKPYENINVELFRDQVEAKDWLVAQK